jgi:hypothetical protein
VGPRAGLDAASKRRIPSSRQESNPDRPACSQSLYRLSYIYFSVSVTFCIHTILPDLGQIFFFLFLFFLTPSLRRQIFLFTFGSFRHLVGLLGRGISPAPRPLPTHRTTQHRETQTHINAPSRIRTCYPNVRAAEDSSCLRPRGY